MNIALLGNPNVGKTTLFNSLTGSNQYVGNWAGVTVEKKEGFLDNFKIIDLPGIYSMDAFSNEEKISRNFLETESIDLIINIVDASNLDRNLYLTYQLKQYKKPMILVLNMIDVAEKKGYKFNLEKLEKNFRMKIFPIIASKAIGLDEIKKYIQRESYSNSLDLTPPNFTNENEAYNYIDSMVSSCRIMSAKTKLDLSESLDSILLNPILAYPMFLLILLFIFKFTFSWVGAPLSKILGILLNSYFMPYLNNLLAGASPLISSLIVNGIVGGVGGILTLLPVILALFFCITILEDSGYMARVAFLMDKIMRKIGLSGKAFIPMILGFGCSVPAIMSARTLESEKDRRLAALLIPLMSCNAKLPIYMVFALALFPKNQGLLIASLYGLGILIAFIMALIFKNSLFKKDEHPFIIELPKIKMPNSQNILNQLSEKTKGFLAKAGTTIFAMSVTIWFLQAFNSSGQVANINQSFLYSIGNFIAPFFRPLGFGTWEASVSLLTGIMAKETVVSTLSVIYGNNLLTIIPLHFTQVSAYAFLVFVLLYSPCISVIGTMKKEFGFAMTVFSVIYQILLAWIASFLFFTVGSMFFH